MSRGHTDAGAPAAIGLPTGMGAGTRVETRRAFDAEEMGRTPISPG